jgi:hypothetical protein
MSQLNQVQQLQALQLHTPTISKMTEEASAMNDGYNLISIMCGHHNNFDIETTHWIYHHQYRCLNHLYIFELLMQSIIWLISV